METKTDSGIFRDDDVEVKLDLSAIREYFGDDVDLDSLVVSYEDGVASITLPGFEGTLQMGAGSEGEKIQLPSEPPEPVEGEEPVELPPEGESPVPPDEYDIDIGSDDDDGGGDGTGGDTNGDGVIDENDETRRENPIDDLVTMMREFMTRSGKQDDLSNSIMQEKYGFSYDEEGNIVWDEDNFFSKQGDIYDYIFGELTAEPTDLELLMEDVGIEWGTTALDVLRGDYEMPDAMKRERDKDWNTLKESLSRSGINIEGDTPESAVAGSTAGASQIESFLNRWDQKEQSYGMSLLGMSTGGMNAPYSTLEGAQGSDATRGLAAFDSGGLLNSLMGGASGNLQNAGGSLSTLLNLGLQEDANDANMWAAGGSIITQLLGLFL